MKKYRFLAVFMLLLLTSCRYSGEVQRRIVVHAIGIDPSENGFGISYQVFSGTSDESGPVDADESTVVTLTAEGRTLYEAEENLRLKTGKEVFLGDCELILINEELKNTDLRDFLPYFKNSDIYLGVNAVFCKGSAAEAVGAKLEQGAATAILLRGIVDEARKCGKALSSRIIEISNALEGDNEAIVIPILDLKKDSAPDGSTLTKTDIGVFSSQIITPNGPGSEISASAVTGISLLKQRAEAVELTVSVPGGEASASVDDIKIKRKLHVADGKPIADITIEGVYRVEACPPGTDEEDIRASAEREILRLCGEGYRYLKEGDILEVGKALYKYENKFATKNEARLSEIIPETSFNVRVKLRKY